MVGECIFREHYLTNQFTRQHSSLAKHFYSGLYGSLHRVTLHGHQRVYLSSIYLMLTQKPCKGLDMVNRLHWSMHKANLKLRPERARIYTIVQKRLIGPFPSHSLIQEMTYLTEETLLERMKNWLSFCKNDWSAHTTKYVTIFGLNAESSWGHLERRRRKSKSNVTRDLTLGLALFISDESAPILREIPCLCPNC